MGHPIAYRVVQFSGSIILEAIVSTGEWHANNSSKPNLRDHGVPEHDVFKRVSAEDFADFYKLVVDAAKLAREALDATTRRPSAKKWRELFGSKFPEPPDGDDDDGEDGGSGGNSGGPAKGGFTPRTAPSVVTGGRFA